MMSVIWEPRLDERAVGFKTLAAELTRQHFAPAAADVDREGRYPSEHVKVLADHGLSGMFVPEVYGGQGATLTATCAVMEEIAAGCASTAAILSVYVLGAFPVILAGTDEQRRRYLGGLVARSQATSFALTEQRSGSDAAALETTAAPVDGGYRLRGEKWFIGNGGESAAYVVFAKTNPEAGARGISAFMVDRDADGAVIDHYEDKMGLRGTRTSNLKLDTVIDASAMVGEQGRGLRLALDTLNVGRISVAGQALGIAYAAYDAAVRRAAVRETFGRPILDNQAISFRLADTATELSAARMLMYEAAGAYDRGEDVATLGAMAKLYATEAAHRAVDAAVQVFGGYGYCKPYAVERHYRDQRITEIYEGSSEIQRLVLSRAITKAVHP